MRTAKALKYLFFLILFIIFINPVTISNIVSSGKTSASSKKMRTFVFVKNRVRVLKVKFPIFYDGILNN